MEIVKKKEFANGVVYALRLDDGMMVETTDTFLPEYTDSQTLKPTEKDYGSRKGRWMIGVSTMSGCPVRCKFCATGTMPKARNLTANPVTHICFGVGAVESVGIHFDISVELSVGIRAGRITTEEHGRINVAQLGFDTNGLPHLLDEGLSALAYRIGGGLEQDAQANAIFLANTVRTDNPTSFIEQPVGFFYVLGQTLIVGC